MWNLDGTDLEVINMVSKIDHKKQKALYQLNDKDNHWNIVILDFISKIVYIVLNLFIVYESLKNIHSIMPLNGMHCTDKC